MKVENDNSPKRERIPQASQTIKESPTLPEFCSTPLGEIKMPLPTMVPMAREIAWVRVIFLLRKTASLASGASLFFLQQPISQSLFPRSYKRFVFKTLLEIWPQFSVSKVLSYS